MKLVKVLKSFIGTADERAQWGNPMTGVVENVSYTVPWSRQTCPIKGPGQVTHGRQITVEDKRAEELTKLGIVEIIPEPSPAPSVEPESPLPDSSDPMESVAVTAGDAGPPSPKRGKAK